MGDEIVSYVRSLKGTPFVHQGRVPGVGIDCVGLLILTGRHLGLCAPDFDFTGYSRFPDGSMLKVLKKHLSPIPYNDATFGDVVAFMCDKNLNEPQHVAVLVPYHKDVFGIVHASSDDGKVIEQRMVFGPHLRFVQAFRFPEAKWHN